MVTNEQSVHAALARVPKGRPSGMDRRGDLVGDLKARKLGQVAKELMKCCSRPLPNGGFLTVKEAEGGLRHVSGLMHCGRHLCPICHPFHAAERRGDLFALVGVNWEAGQHFLFTPTARHRRGVKWAELKDSIKAVAKKMQSQRRWKESVLGFTRADESTWSDKSGHHFHQHYLLTLRHGVDGDSFAEWLQGFWEKAMTKEGRTCDWDGMDREWWKPVRSEAELGLVMNYQTKDWEDDQAGETTPEDLRGALKEVTGAGTKGQTPWDWPAEVFAEVWTASKGHRWFGTAGIWKAKNAPEVTEDEIEARREAKGTAIAWIHAEDWNALAQEVRDDLLRGAYSRDMDRGQFLRWWGECSEALGGVLGLGEPPEDLEHG